MTFLNNKNLMFAYKLARKARKNKQEVYLFEQQLEMRILDILSDLQNRIYKHSPYKEIVLVDSKKRYIYSPVFRDHIFHYLVYNQIYGILDSKMVYSSFACRKWFGSHKAVDYLVKIIKAKEKKLELEKSLYYLKIDFSKYFFSINHDLLKQKLRKYIFDEDMLYCIDLIIDSYKTNKIYNNLLKDEEFYINEENKWLPIWWLMSQILANFYLNDLDQFLKHTLKVKFVRYMDDIVIIWTKKELNFISKQIFSFIKRDKLILNPRKISFNLISDWLSFVWYKIKDKKIYVWKHTKNNANKFIDELSKINLDNFSDNDKKRVKSSLYSRLWVFSHSSFWLNYFKSKKVEEIL